MNKISIKMDGFEINCDPEAFPSVFQALRGSNNPKIEVTLDKPQEKAASAPNEPTSVTPTPETPAENSSRLIKLMDKWNRLHAKDISMRGRRFSAADKKMLTKIAIMAREEDASITWVAHTCRVSSATIHRAEKWDDQG